jgi:hypothetical protein
MKRNEKDYCEMTIVDYHREYNMPKHPFVDMTMVWNGYDVESIIDAAFKAIGFNDESKWKVCSMTEDIMYAVFKQMHCTGVNALPKPIESITDDEMYMYVWRVRGSYNDLKSWARQFRNNITHESHSVGGDDSYFDYFPNYMNMFWQVCHELELEEYYRSAYDYITKYGRYAEDYNDEECGERCLPEW